MTTPDFNNLTPPGYMVQAWSLSTTNLPTSTLAYRAGASHGYERARQLWPQPITDRPPTEADADDSGLVQTICLNGCWGCGEWRGVAITGRSWRHSPRWQPRQPSLQEQALESLLSLQASNIGDASHFEVIRRALEQAGERVES